MAGRGQKFWRIHMAYRPVYFTETEGRLAAVIPMMEVCSFLTGKRAVSLPFTDYCEPFVPHVEVSKVLFEAIIQEGRKRQWEYIELRGGADFLGDGPASAWFYRHILDLTPGEATIFKGLRDSTRRNIKKAEKEGVDGAVRNHPGSPAGLLSPQLPNPPRARPAAPALAVL